MRPRHRRPAADDPRACRASGPQTPTAIAATPVRAAAVAILGVLALAAPPPTSGYWFKECSYGTQLMQQTSLVADVLPGAGDGVGDHLGHAARRHHLARFAGSVFFQADDGQHGSELWRAAGGGAALAADLVAGPGGSSPHAFAVFQNQLYFAATTPATGEELFRFDGGTAELVGETMPGPAGGTIHGLSVHGGALYFVRGTPNDGQQVWRWDGATLAPVGAINAAPGQLLASGAGDALVSAGGSLYHVRATPPPERIELWRFDGLVAHKVAAMTTGDLFLTTDWGLGVQGGSVFFGVASPDPYDSTKRLWELQRHDPVNGLSSLGSLPGDGFVLGYFHVFGGKLHFVHGLKLYRLDGGLPQLLASGGASGLPVAPRNLGTFAAAGRLFLSGAEPSPAHNREPYLYDGTTAARLANIHPDEQPVAGLSSGSFPSFPVEADGLYFFASDDLHGRELWRTVAHEVPVFDCDILVGLDWSLALRWSAEHREVTVASWLVTAEETRLLVEEAYRLEAGRSTRVDVLEFAREAVPEAFALVTILTDDESGEVVEQGYEMVGTPTAVAEEAIGAAVAELLGWAGR